MKKLKTFFITIFRSFTDPGYYNDVLEASNSFSLKYFSLYYVFLSLLVVSVFSYSMYQNLPSLLDSSIDTIVAMYPNDLEVTLDTQKSEVSVHGAPEPIIITLPESENAEITTKNLLVIDTNASVEDFGKYETALLLTKTNLISIANQGQAGYQVIPLTDITEGLSDEASGRTITSLTLNKSFIESNIPLVKSVAQKVMKILPFALFPLFALGYIASRLIYLAFMTLLVSILSVLTGKNLSYGKLFQIGLHTITVTDGITKLQQLVFQNPVPMLYSFAFLGITFIALLGITSTKKTSAIS